MSLIGKYSVDVMQTLETINPRLGNTSVNLYPAGTLIRKARASRLIDDFARINEICPAESDKPKAIGPISVSGDLGHNILDAMTTWLTEVEMGLLTESVLEGGNFEAEDLLRSDVFSEILLKRTDYRMSFLFDIPDEELGEAFGELCCFLVEYEMAPHWFSIYIFGDAEKLLHLAVRIGLDGASILAD